MVKILINSFSFFSYFLVLLFFGNDIILQLLVLLFSQYIMSDSATPWTVGSSIHGISQVRILEWVVIPPPGHLADSRIEPRSPGWQADSLLLSHLGSHTIEKLFVCLLKDIVHISQGQLKSLLPLTILDCTVMLNLNGKC